MATPSMNIEIKHKGWAETKLNTYVDATSIDVNKSGCSMWAPLHIHTHTLYRTAHYAHALYNSVSLSCRILSFESTELSQFLHH